MGKHTRIAIIEGSPQHCAGNLPALSNSFKCIERGALANAQIRMFVQERVKQLPPMDGCVHESVLTMIVHAELEQFIAFVPEEKSVIQSFDKQKSLSYQSR